ncbi:Mlp family lipoprotein (plasmid) [Borrelia miyamotoi]|uniref:Mlp family lipoprotein n=1 Tax=Borrelia miyamotoi TaxID=47466 RepID=A0A5P8ARA0_9SPIR|nr:Mlp family lipoprotein [Borrelia miyamotoi]QFP42440.1 Mlp family lipoprotein [Borrelia miyamotoi]WAZ72304.1 Mlp family lipoprotein [Borrelia miyamotoi]WVI05300.1 Mlp family lipoprotein [Borrelia miyamotoi]
MNKFIYYLIMCGTLLCGTLFLYHCDSGNPMYEENNLTSNSITTSQIANENINLANDKQKFDTFKSGLNTIIITSNTQESQEAKYQGFIEWLSNNPQKQKELTNAFTIVYDFLDDQRRLQSSNLTNEQLVINTIKCISVEQDNPKCNEQDYIYHIDNYIHNVHNVDEDYLFKIKFYTGFYSLLKEIDIKNTNEEIFERIRDNLIEKSPSIGNMIGPTRYEAALRKEFDGNQNKGLDFLKAALNDQNNLYLFLILNKTKVKAVLEHIASELKKCNGNNAQKDTFEEDIRKHFDIILNKELNEIVQITVNC